MRMFRAVMWFTLGAALAWIGGLIFLIATLPNMVYPFASGIDASRPAGVPGMRTEIVLAQDGTPLTLWVVQPQADRPVILYFMGNAGSLPHSAPRLAEFAHRGFGILALNYRGAGGQPGSPSQEALVSDALAVYGALNSLIGENVPPERRIVYGNSLGAAVAVQLAAWREAAALVLETPFNRLCDLADHHFPIYPACLILPYERWDSAAMIGQVTAPILIQHGDADETIPLGLGQALYDAADEPKQMIVYPGGHHNDLRLFGAGQDAIAFIESITGP